MVLLLLRVPFGATWLTTSKTCVNISMVFKRGIKVRSFVVPEGSFVSLPTLWGFELPGEDLKRLFLLHYRFKYFADQAFARGEDVRRCYYESQEVLCSLFGMSLASRTKVGKFLKRMEESGHISVIREKVMLYGSMKPRHYITVNDPSLLQKYRLNP